MTNVLSLYNTDSLDSLWRSDSQALAKLLKITAHAQTDTVRGFIRQLIISRNWAESNRASLINAAQHTVRLNKLLSVVLHGVENSWGVERYSKSLCIRTYRTTKNPNNYYQKHYTELNENKSLIYQLRS